MEIIEYLRGRWLAAAVVAPVLAGVLAVAIFSSLETGNFQAKASVPVAQAVAGEVSSREAIGPIIDDFRALLDSVLVAEAVAAELDRPVGGVRGKYGSGRVGNGSDVEVSFVAATEQEAEAGLDAGVRAALVAIAQGQRQRAEVEFRAFTAQVASAKADLQEISVEAGAYDLANEYAARSADLLTLRNDIASGSGSISLYNEKLAELARLGALLQDWNLAKQRLDGASESRDSAERRARLYDEIEQEMQTGRVLRSSRVSEQSSLPAVALPTVLAMAAAFAVVLFTALARGRATVRIDDLRSELELESEPTPAPPPTPTPARMSEPYDVAREERSTGPVSAPPPSASPQTAPVVSPPSAPSPTTPSYSTLAEPRPWDSPARGNPSGGSGDD